MTGIQVILVSGVLLLLLYYAFRLRNALLDLIVLVVFSGLAVFFILFPEKTNTIAQKLGVGRGADLLFYACILFFVFIIMKLFARMRRLEKKLTDYVRKDAKEQAQRLNDTTGKNEHNS